MDEVYYITHTLIPPLERIFNLVGTDVRKWFNDMPKPGHLDVTRASSVATADEEENYSKNRHNIDEHFKSLLCAVCKQPSGSGE